MLKKKMMMLGMLLALGVGCLSMGANADETENVSETVTEAAVNEPLELEGLGVTVKNTSDWEGLKGYLVIYPVASTSLVNDPELYVAQLFYVPASEEDTQDEESVEALSEMMTVAGMLFTVKGDREQLLTALKELGMEFDEEEQGIGLVQVGEADGYQFFLLYIEDDSYATSLEEIYAEDYRNLPELMEKELRQAQYYAPKDAMAALIGKTLSFTTTDLHGNTVTSEELFKDNEITMVNLWGVWCINCVNEMEELAAINTRIQEKGCGIVGLEWEQDPSEETYQQGVDLMKEKGTNYPSVLMPEDNEILSMIESFPATFYVDREGTILTKPIIGARVKEYEPTLEALLEGVSIPETEIKEAGSYTYRVFVKDEEDQPIGEVTVQFCDETSCRIGETDEDGCASFEVSEEKAYEVHVLPDSDEYDVDEDEVFTTDETASDLTIVLKKAE